METGIMFEVNKLSEPENVGKQTYLENGSRRMGTEIKLRSLKGGSS